MKPLVLSFLTLLSVLSFAQETTKPSVLLGVNLNSVVSFADTPDRYSLFPTVNGGYYTDQTNNSLSNFFQLESEFRWDHFYASAGIGIGFENINLTATNVSTWANSSVGGSESSQTSYDLTMKENHTYLIASLEGGYLFNKPNSRFRFGLGLGMDFSTDLSSSILENTLIRNNTTTIYVEGGPNAGTTTTSTTTEYDNTSGQWSSTVRDAVVFPIMPQLGFSSYYDLNENVGLSLKANTRYLFYRRYQNADLRLKVQFPVSFGVYFKL